MTTATNAQPQLLSCQFTGPVVHDNGPTRNIVATVFVEADGTGDVLLWFDGHMPGDERPDQRIEIEQNMTAADLLRKLFPQQRDS